MKLKSTTTGLVALVAAAAMSLTACGGSGSAQDQNTLRIAMIPGASVHVLDYVAKARGFVGDTGLDIEEVNSKSGPDQVNLVLSGDVDFAATTTTSVLPAARRLSIVSGAQEDYGTMLVAKPALVAKAAEDGLDALGKLKIGVPTTPSYFQYQAAEVLKEAGVEIDALTFIAVGGGPTQMGALKSGQVDMIMSGPIATAQLQAAGEGEVVMAMQDVETFAGFPEIVYFGPREDAKEEAIAKYLGALEKAKEWAQDPANADELTQIIADAYGVEDPATVEKLGEIYAVGQGDLISQNNFDIDPDGFASLVDFMVDNELLDEKVALDDVYDPIKPEGA